MILHVWSDSPGAGHRGTNSTMESVLGRDKLGSGVSWCQGRKVTAVETSSADSVCARKYLTTDSPEEK